METAKFRYAYMDDGIMFIQTSWGETPLKTSEALKMVESIANAIAEDMEQKEKEE